MKKSVKSGPSRASTRRTSDLGASCAGDGASSGSLRTGCAIFLAYCRPSYGTALATCTPGDSDISRQPERDDA